MLRTLKQFIVDDLKRLASQLSDLEANVDTETREIRASYVPLTEPTAVITRASGPYSVGQMVVANTAAGSFSVTVAAPLDRRAGWLHVRKTAAAGTLTVETSPPTVQINNAASIAITAVGMTAIYFDGSNFWR